MKRRLLTLCLLLVLAALAGAAPARAVLFAGERIDGPGIDVRLGGISVARDGTGALVYSKADDAGVVRVYASVLSGGAWSAPQQLDAGLTGASSEPVVAAGAGGEVLAAFVNGGRLYTVSRPAGAAGGALPAPVALPEASAAVRPSIALSIHGKGYLAFTDRSGGQSHVRAAYLTGYGWVPIPETLDGGAGAAGRAGAGTADRPRIAVAGDGIAVAAWGESGKVYARRVVYTRASTAAAITVSPDSLSDARNALAYAGGAADSPEIGVGYDNGLPTIAFRQTFLQNGRPVYRVVARRLRGTQPDAPYAADGQSFPTAEDARDPRIALNGDGIGPLSSGRDGSHGTWAKIVGHSPPAVRLDAGDGTGRPYPVTTLAGRIGAVAWQSSTASGSTDVRVRLLAADAFGPEASLTNPLLGPTAADRGLEASGDFAGDLAVAFVQGAPGAQQIVVGGQDVPPGAFTATVPTGFVPTVRPLLSWTAAEDRWGGARYSVRVDGQVVATTTDTRARPTPLHDGSHTVQVSAVDRRGQSSVSPRVRVFTDTTAPTTSLRVRGRRVAGARVRILVRAADLAPPPPPGTAARPVPTSGVAQVLVRFGDGKAQRGTRGPLHRYARPGRYRVYVTVVDAAGNKRHASLAVRITRR